MPKHTPGPWWQDDDGMIAAGSGDTYRTIADPLCTDPETAAANARLIAAAPELLASLRELLEDICILPRGEYRKRMERAEALLGRLDA